MDPDAIIEFALLRGAAEGLDALSAVSRRVFLISEAECLCDMEGIDAFLDRYEPAQVLEAAEAFASIGAREIAAGLERLANSPQEQDLSYTNSLVTARSGYDYGAIRAMVEASLQLEE